MKSDEKGYWCQFCRHAYYTWFCSYKSRNCHIHGLIDMNPDSYLNTLKDDEECPDFKIKKVKHNAE